jgi:hypothetical protein
MFYTPFVFSIVLEYNLITELQSYLNNSVNYKIMNINKFTIKSQEPYSYPNNWLRVLVNNRLKTKTRFQSYLWCRWKCGTFYFKEIEC